MVSLKARRERFGISRAALQRRLGVAYSTLERVERTGQGDSVGWYDAMLAALETMTAEQREAWLNR